MLRSAEDIYRIPCYDAVHGNSTIALIISEYAIAITCKNDSE